MLYILAIILGIAAGIIAKGKVSNFLNLKFEKSWIILCAFGIQLAAQILGVNGFNFVVKYSIVIQGISLSLVLLAFWFNRHYLGIKVIGLGCFLNALVMMSNGGKMPVSYDAVASANLTGVALDMLKAGMDGKHILIGEHSKLIFLADIMHPPSFLGFMMQVVSIGDLVVVGGLFILLFEGVTNKKINLRKKSKQYTVDS